MTHTANKADSPPPQWRWVHWNCPQGLGPSCSTTGPFHCVPGCPTSLPSRSWRRTCPRTCRRWLWYPSGQQRGSGLCNTLSSGRRSTPYLTLSSKISIMLYGSLPWKVNRRQLRCVTLLWKVSTTLYDPVMEWKITLWDPAAMDIENIMLSKPAMKSKHHVVWPCYRE